MKNKVVLLSAIFVLISLFLFPAKALAQDQELDDIEVIVTTEGDMECRMTTFEGADDFCPIDGWIPGLNAYFGDDWVTTTSLGISNYPSPVSIAFWIDDNPEVLFEEPVAAVSFYYSSQVALTLQAFDEDGNMVASTVVPANCRLGNFEIWDPIGIAVDENVITRLRINGPASYTAIDNFKTCRIINQAPVINSVTADPSKLWPPNHKAIDVTLTVDAADPDGVEDIVRTTYSVVDEYGEYDVAETDLPENGIISLIAERDGKDKDGRVYTITVTVYDAGGLSDSSSVDVIVTHDQGKKGK